MMNKTDALIILDNYINGNLTDFKAHLKKMSKKKLIDFIYFCIDEYEGDKFTTQEILSIVYKAL